jgi:hypothetical protein
MPIFLDRFMPSTFQVSAEPLNLAAIFPLKMYASGADARIGGPQ